IGFNFADQLTHTWDLATALGRDRTLDPELVEVAYSAVKDRIGPEMRGPGRPFGAEEPCAESAPPSDRPAAFLGRKLCVPADPSPAWEQYRAPSPRAARDCPWPCGGRSRAAPASRAQRPHAGRRGRERARPAAHHAADERPADHLASRLLHRAGARL